MSVTRTTNARIAAITLILYIVVGIAGMVVSRGATAGVGAARLTGMVQHAPQLRASALLGFLTCFVALTLGVALYALTRDEDRDLAMLALLCRVAEGVVGAFSIPLSLGLLSMLVATPEAANDTAVQSLSTFLSAARRTIPIIAATFFAVGSLLFSWLLVRGRIVPAVLGWVGVVSSLLLVVCLPLQLAAVLGGTVVNLMWIPMAVFEIWLAVWLLIKGTATPAARAV